jgi:putative ABC transport system permease protein
MSTAIHLSLSEIWRNRGRFVLFSLVVALITVLILFVAALGEGLGTGNRELIENLNAELIVYQDTARLSIASSRIDEDTLRAVRYVDGVRAVGSLGFSSAAVILDGEDEPLDVALIGIEPGKPGEPSVVSGQGLRRKNGDEAIVDRTIAAVAGLEVGDEITLRTLQGDEDEFYTLKVVGISESQKYGIRPSVFAPLYTWDEVRAKGTPGRSTAAPVGNVAAVQLEDPAQMEVLSQQIETRVDGVQAVDRRTAYESTPGYTEQQSTLGTQNAFALLIGVLVIGGFFQIQTLQKVPQIGMLKAIGTPNAIVAVAALLQIVAVTLLGVLIGSAVTLALSLGFPPNIPIVFEPGSAALAVGTIMLMGPLGGLVSVRYSLKVEPLIALGLSA